MIGGCLRVGGLQYDFVKGGGRDRSISTVTEYCQPFIEEKV